LFLNEQTDICVRVNRTISVFLVMFVCLAGVAAQAATGRVIKVLPHLLDTNGLHTISPSHYERDAYQAKLNQNPLLVAGVRYDVQYKTRGPQFSPFRLQVELRGIAQGNLPRQSTLVQEVRPTSWFGRWTQIRFDGQAFIDFGRVTAWRVTLWEGGELLSEQTSFLW
jgi:hypothetical protein